MTTSNHPTNTPKAGHYNCRLDTIDSFGSWFPNLPNGIPRMGLLRFVDSLCNLNRLLIADRGKKKGSKGSTIWVNRVDDLVIRFNKSAYADRYKKWGLHRGNLDTAINYLIATGFLTVGSHKVFGKTNQQWNIFVRKEHLAYTCFMNIRETSKESNYKCNTIYLKLYDSVVDRIGVCPAILMASIMRHIEIKNSKAAEFTYSFYNNAESGMFYPYWGHIPRSTYKKHINKILQLGVIRRNDTANNWSMSPLHKSILTSLHEEYESVERTPAFISHSAKINKRGNSPIQLVSLDDMV